MVCAVVVAPGDLSDLRTFMKGQRVKGSRRIHMKSESDATRKRLLASISDLNIEARLYLTSTRGVSQRVARDRCLRSMVPDLCSAGVRNLYLESCSQDLQDSRVLIDARRGTTQRDQFHFDHRSPASEPLLWLPDAIAWAWGRDSSWRARVEGLVTARLEVAA
jgi:hypothetical protein